ncbi:MAG: metallophosphoesterase [Myxococcales bacterium]|nr:MAG: metallophosphoesterase [Myxococcales bacterium]
MSLGRILIFFGVIFGLTLGTHYYLWARLIRDPMWPSPWRQVATVALILLALSIPASMLAWRTLPRNVAIPVSWVGYVWMGSMFLLLVLLWGGELARWGWVKYASMTSVDGGRREFLAQLLAGGAGAVGLALSGWGVWSAIRPVEVKRVPIRLRKLPPRLDGLRLVQLTDMHVGLTIGREFVEDVVQKVNALDPDIVAITGDLIDGTVEDLGHSVAPLGNIQASLGTFFVTGNHEYYSGADSWLGFLQTLGIRALRNEHVELEKDGETIHVAGVDDWTAHQFGRGHGADMARAMQGRDITKPVVLLAHQPVQFEEAREHGVDLQISGHTHGGQIFPFGVLTRLVQPFLSGLHRRGDSQIYVSSGTGYWGPPMRIAAPAEITLIELDHEPVV